MEVSVTEAEEQLDDLVRRAEAGEEVILTCNGRPAVRLLPIGQTTPEERARRHAALEKFRKEASAKMTPGPSAARSQDFLYDERGLPG